MSKEKTFFERLTRSMPENTVDDGRKITTYQASESKRIVLLTEKKIMAKKTANWLLMFSKTTMK